MKFALFVVWAISAEVFYVFTGLHSWPIFCILMSGCVTSLAWVVSDWQLRRTLRGAFREWQKTNNERHRLSGLALQQLNRANALDLELIELRKDDGLRRLVIETFLDPATVDAALRVMASRFSDACWEQRDFLLAVKTQGISSANIQIELNAVQAQFHDLQRKNDQLKMGVETAKTKFWKAHDLVNTAIEEGILPPAYTLRNGASFSKYLPPKDQTAQ